MSKFVRVDDENFVNLDRIWHIGLEYYSNHEFQFYFYLASGTYVKSDYFKTKKAALKWLKEVGGVVG